MTLEKLDTRVAVLETETKVIKEDIKELKSYSNEIFNIVSSTKERLDKQNGAIPSISEKLNDLGIDQKLLSNNLDRFILLTEKNVFKSKIIWGVVGGVGSGLLIVILKVLFGL